MKAAVIRAYGGPDELRLEDRPDPIPGPGYVLVRVAATSVNPFDLKMRSGVFKDVIRLTFPAILGFDVSGVVEAVGPGVESFGRGDRVFAQATQTYASLCLVKATDLVRIPAHMDIIDVAALPTVTTTGSQLADLATQAQPSGTVLVTGADGKRWTFCCVCRQEQRLDRHRWSSDHTSGTRQSDGGRSRGCARR
jgi:NADPH:quinone reductase-like Zn-dependent oxidoreductase